jgi:hypothetical protein
MVAAARVECVGGGEPLVFPDFTLRHEGGSVLVEVVGFYTPKYLRSKLDALRAAAAHPLIACIDESLACADGTRFRRVPVQASNRRRGAHRDRGKATRGASERRTEGGVDGKGG